ncbi:hypothetical protein ACYT7O_10770, partial [Streptococcus pyogenes]
LTLEDAKHGTLHVRLQWYKLSADPLDLQDALIETQHLRVASMSTALLIVFIDSARHLKVSIPAIRDPLLFSKLYTQ